MRKIVLLAIVAVLFCAVAVAQNDPKAEVYVGYNYAHATYGVPGAPSMNLNGWTVQATGYVTKHIGVTADFGSVYGDFAGEPVKVHGYLFGPTFRFPKDKIKGFAHVLVGDMQFSLPPISASTMNGFGMAVGGGLDYNLTKRIGLRVAQGDYVYTHIFTLTQNNFRYSSGIVFKF